MPFSNSTKHDLHDVISKVTEVPIRVTHVLQNGLRKYLTGYATSDPTLPFSSYHSTEHFCYWNVSSYVRNKQNNKICNFNSFNLNCR